MSGRAGAGRTALLYKTLALVLVAGSAVFLVKTLYRDSASTVDAADARVADRHAVDAPPQASYAAARGRDVTARPAGPGGSPDDGPGGGPDGGPGSDLAAFIPPGEEPTMAEVIDELHKAGIHTGLGAFNPPGTSPPLVGLAVPEDYPLPEGYVRHFQATDDGQRIEPILMYSPDFEFFDAAGRRIPIPANRVVPPNMAPPGLAVRLIEIPPPLQTPSPSR